MEINRFLEIEKKYALYSQKINGINYWNYSRVQIWNYEICSQKLNLQNPHPMRKFGIAEQIKNIAMLLKNSIWRGKGNPKTDILFMAHERRTKVDGVYQCVYTNSLAKCFPDSVILDKPFEYKHLKPESDLKRYYVDYIKVAGNLHYQLHKFFKTKHYRTTLLSVQEQMKCPLQEIMDSYQISIPINTLYKILHRNLLAAEYDLKLYDKILMKFRPKIIVEVVYYSMHCMMLNELAKKYGVVTIELQHGTMHKDHAAYQINWDEIIPQLPDRIFLFSEFWKNMLHMPIDSDNLIVTGFPHFDQNKKKYNAMKTSKIGKTILFISQGTIGTMLSKFAVEVANELVPKGYRIIYKLHPAEENMWKEKYPDLIKAGIIIEGCNSKDIYECFSISDVQVGVYSTAIYEGLGFGLRTFIYNIGHADTLYQLVEEGYAQLVNNCSELIALLKEEDVSGKENLFWASNSLLAMSSQIQQLLDMK